MIIKGTPVSAGYAVGKVFLYKPLERTTEKAFFAAGEEERQMKLWRSAFHRAKGELGVLISAFEKEDPQKAEIFAAHREILQDQKITGDVEQAVRVEHICPDYAVEYAFEQACHLLEQVNDPVIASRTADLRDVKNRILNILTGTQAMSLGTLTEQVIVVANELLPSDTAMLDREHVIGIITEAGSINSHAAIIARSYGIPAILGVKNVMECLTDDTQIGLDAVKGEIVTGLTEEAAAHYQELKRVFTEKKDAAAYYLSRPAVMKDGQRIEIGLNVGSEFFGTKTLNYDFVGLFRTEFLYMKKKQQPSEEEQLKAYRLVLEQARGKTVTLRTLDIGGDKTLPYLQLVKEENPFLGKRALRLCLDQKVLFETQLRAALRASVFGDLQIMFPMVGSMEDIRAAKTAVYHVMAQLDRENIAYNKEIKLGIMIEIPSVALLADLAAQEVDFASIGTNDLIQYLCAADRMNAEMSTYYQSFSPAALRLLGYVFEQFGQKNKPISVCGELAGNPAAAVLLVGLGARKLSMNEGNIPNVKAALAQVSIAQAEKTAKVCMKMKTEQEVKTYLGCL